MDERGIDMQVVLLTTTDEITIVYQGSATLDQVVVKGDGTVEHTATPGITGAQIFISGTEIEIKCIETDPMITVRVQPNGRVHTITNIEPPTFI